MESNNNLEALARFVAELNSATIDGRVAKIGSTSVLLDKEGDVVMIDGRPVDYDHEVVLEKLVHPDAIGSHTLWSIADFYGAFGTSGSFVHIFSPTQLKVKTQKHQIDGKRDVLIDSTFPGPAEGHLFGAWMKVSDFVVWMLSGFIPNDHSDDLLELLGKGVKVEAARQVAEDGVSVELKQSRGVHVEWADKVHPHFTLKPRCTFPEIDQPERLCTFGVKNDADSDSVMVRLVDSDGGAWKATAITSIKDWLQGKIPADVPIIA